MLWDFNQIYALSYSVLTCSPLHIRQIVISLLGLEGRERAQHKEGTECACEPSHLRLSLYSFLLGHIPMFAGGIFSSAKAQLTLVREVPSFSLSPRDWLNPDVPLKSILKTPE